MSKEFVVLMHIMRKMYSVNIYIYTANVECISQKKDKIWWWIDKGFPGSILSSSSSLTYAHTHARAQIHIDVNSKFLGIHLSWIK